MIPINVNSILAIFFERFVFFLYIYNKKIISTPIFYDEQPHHQDMRTNDFINMHYQLKLIFNIKKIYIVKICFLTVFYLLQLDGRRFKTTQIGNLIEVRF